MSNETNEATYDETWYRSQLARETAARFEAAARHRQDASSGQEKDREEYRVDPWWQR